MANIGGSLWHRGCLEGDQNNPKIRRVAKPPTEEAQLKQERDALRELIQWAKETDRSRGGFQLTKPLSPATVMTRTMNVAPIHLLRAMDSCNLSTRRALS